MDRARFDALARLLAAKGSRRGALGALLGVALLGHDPDHGLAKRGKHKDTRKRAKRRRRRDKQRKKQTPPGARAARCCRGTRCIPGPGKNLTDCCFVGENLDGASFHGADLGDVNFTGATLTGANFSGANLDGACFVGADLTGARLAGTHPDRPIFCRTIMPDGSRNDDDCNQGTACCPTCIPLGAACTGGADGGCCGEGACRDDRCCALKTCAVDYPNQCGTFDDGCGGEVTCRCGRGCCDSAGEVCKAGTDIDACGADGQTCSQCTGGAVCYNRACCQPKTTCGAAVDCGDVPDGCGGTWQCGTCPAPQVCWQGACACGDVCAAGCKYTSVQAAIDDAAADAAIRLCAGVYFGENIAIGKNLTLVGVGDGDAAASNTILDAGGQGTVVNVASGVTASLQGLRISGGSAAGGGGVRNAGSLTMTECTIIGNSGQELGGGIVNASGALTLTRCTVMSNTTGANGGGIYIGGGTATLVTSVVRQNTADSNAGGIFVGPGCTLNVTNNSQITENDAGNVSGGLGVDEGGKVVFDASSSVTNNSSETPPSGIGNYGGTVALNGATVAGNSPEPQCLGVSGC